MNDKTYISDVDDEKISSYFFSAMKSEGVNPKIVQTAFKNSLIDYFDKKIDNHTLSAIAHVIYFEISDPSSIHSWPDSHMTSLISDLHELSYNTHKANDGDEASQKEVERLISKARDYFENSN